MKYSNLSYEPFIFHGRTKIEIYLPCEKTSKILSEKYKKSVLRTPYTWFGLLITFYRELTASQTFFLSRIDFAFNLMNFKKKKLQSFREAVKHRLQGNCELAQRSEQHEC